tara:strand:+ start:380 stop:547 length:168 start_codon:yes stop_codon:yes gene_type:complete
MSYDIDKITRDEIPLIISVLLFSFLMGFFFGDGSLGFTLFIGVTVYIAFWFMKYR